MIEFGVGVEAEVEEVVGVEVDWSEDEGVLF